MSPEAGVDIYEWPQNRGKKFKKSFNTENSEIIKPFSIVVVVDSMLLGLDSLLSLQV